MVGLVGVAIARIALGKLWPAADGWIADHAAGPLFVIAWAGALLALVAGVFDLTAIEPRPRGVYHPPGRTGMRLAA
jgi:hypothetical protein